MAAANALVNEFGSQYPPLDLGKTIPLSMYKGA